MGDNDALRKYYDQLIEMAEPEMKEIRARKDDRNREILEQECGKEYVAKSTVPTRRRKFRSR